MVGAHAQSSAGAGREAARGLLCSLLEGNWSSSLYSKIASTLSESNNVIDMIKRDRPAGMRVQRPRGQTAHFRLKSED